MQQNLVILKECELFRSINEDNYSPILHCLEAFTKTFQQDETVFHVEDPLDYIGILMQGSLTIYKEDLDGHQQIIADITPGDLFLEAFAFGSYSNIPVSIVSNTKSTVLLLNYKKLIYTCEKGCVFHHQLIFNLLKIMSKKTIHLNQTLEILSKKTIRERVLLFLSFISEGKDTFTIPFTHTQLASYLCVDRSALSHTLSILQNEGKIKYHRQNFKIIK